MNFDSKLDEKIENAGLEDKETVKKFGQSLYKKLYSKTKSITKEFIA